MGNVSSADRPRLGLRTRQALFVLLGLVVAGVMATLGLWQMQRSMASGDAGIAARAAEPPSALLDNVHDDGTFGDVYGKQVFVSGTYLPEQQLAVPATDGTVRVLTALLLPDGRVVPVVRGLAPATGVLPAPPSGTQKASGIFLPGEGEDEASGAGELTSIRMPLLAQKWPQQLTPGFVTLDAARAAAQGLAPAAVTLPHGERSLQNGSYAIQWWLFAAFALGMGLKLAHGLGERERRLVEDEARARHAGSGATVDAAAEPVAPRED